MKPRTATEVLRDETPAVSEDEDAREVFSYPEGLAYLNDAPPSNILLNFKKLTFITSANLR